MEFKVSKYDEHDESKCRANKIVAGDKLYAFDEEHAESLAQLLHTYGCSTRVGYNHESDEWSVYIQSVNNDNKYIKIARNKFSLLMLKS